MPKSDTSLRSQFKCTITKTKEPAHCYRCDEEIVHELHHRGKVLHKSMDLKHESSGIGHIRTNKYLLLDNTLLINKQNFIALLETVDELRDKVAILEQQSKN